MKALSLWQPWASAIVLGWKRVETRHWSTRYRGALAIHAAKRWTAKEREDWAALSRAEGFDASSYELPLGALIATVCLVDVVPTEKLVGEISDQEQRWGNYAPGRFGFVFEGLIKLPEPVPFKGMQGFFDVPDALVTPSMAAPPLDRAAAAPEGQLL